MKNLHWWLLFGCVMLYGFWTLPYFNTERPNLTKAVQVEVNKETQLKKTLSILNQKKSELLSIDEAEDTGPTVPTLLLQEYVILDLKSILERNQYVTQGFSFTKSQNVNLDAAELEISFGVEGPLARFPSLLKTIEQNKRFMGVESVSFNRESNQSDQISASLKLYALAQKY